MMLKVYDLLRSLGWYIVSFIYDLIDGLLEIIKKLNAFDIINSLSNNQAFKNFYTGIMAIAVTLFALFIVWKFVGKLLDPDEETTFKTIIIEVIKCGTLIMLSTFLFVQVSNFSITLSNYTGNLFENSTNSKMSNTMLTIFISYREDYKNSDKFSESKSIEELVKSGSFDNDERYIEKYVTKSRIILSDEKDYKYDINWFMAIISGGFFLYSLFFAGILLERRQIEFLFLFSIAPVVFATSVCNKQRRGAVVEQLVSLALQSAIVMLIVSLTVMIMQEINTTTFFTSNLMNLTTKSLLYLGCATFILTGSQVINRFVGANVSAASGREQLMSLMGYGKMAGIGATVAAGAGIGGGLLATGGILKLGRNMKNKTLEKVGESLGQYGVTSDGESQTKLQRIASNLGAKMYVESQKNKPKERPKKEKIPASEILLRAGEDSIKSVMLRVGYNLSYYRRNKR